MTQEQRAALTPEQRERLEAGEAKALEMLNRKMREDRWYPRRHMRFALMVILALFALLFLAILVGGALQSLIR